MCFWTGKTSTPTYRHLGNFTQSRLISAFDTSTDFLGIHKTQFYYLWKIISEKRYQISSKAAATSTLRNVCTFLYISDS